MGKNKGKPKKKGSGGAAFKVAGRKAMKAKSKAKPVQKNLKRINQQNKSQTSKVNEQLAELQKGASSKSKVPEKNDRPAKAAAPLVDVGATTAEFSRLGN